jgi:hypothetical protein
VPVAFIVRDIIGYVVTGMVILGVVWGPIGRAVAHRIMHGKAPRVPEGAEDPRVDDLSAEMAALREQVEAAQDRLDFTERLLSQARERGQLGPGNGR